METKVMADDFRSEEKVGRPTKVTITLEVGDGHNQEVLALIERILTSQDMGTKGMIDKPEKPHKERKVRIYTDDDRAKFRARMVAAREVKLAKEAELQKKVDVKAETVVDVPEPKKIEKSVKAPVKSTSTTNVLLPKVPAKK